MKRNKNYLLQQLCTPKQQLHSHAITFLSNTSTLTSFIGKYERNDSKLSLPSVHTNATYLRSLQQQSFRELSQNHHKQAALLENQHQMRESVIEEELIRVIQTNWRSFLLDNLVVVRRGGTASDQTHSLVSHHH